MTYILLSIIIAAAEVDSLPGCSQIAVIHSSFVSLDNRAKGVGTDAHFDRLHRLHHDFLYDCCLCTVDDNNIPQINILLKAGWTKACVFKSRKTGHNVGVWIRPLTNGGQEY